MSSPFPPGMHSDTSSETAPPQLQPPRLPRRRAGCSHSRACETIPLKPKSPSCRHSCGGMRGWPVHRPTHAPATAFRTNSNSAPPLCVVPKLLACERIPLRHRSNLQRKKQHRHSGIFRVADLGPGNAARKISGISRASGLPRPYFQNADPGRHAPCQSRAATTSPSQLSTSPPAFSVTAVAAPNVWNDGGEDSFHTLSRACERIPQTKKIKTPRAAAPAAACVAGRSTGQHMLPQPPSEQTATAPPHKTKNPSCRHSVAACVSDHSRGQAPAPATALKTNGNSPPIVIPEFSGAAPAVTENIRNLPRQRAGTPSAPMTAFK